MKKDAVITVRVPRATRRRIQALAQREGRSLSQQVERLITRAMEMGDEQKVTGEAASVRPLRDRFKGGPVPDVEDFRKVRALLSSSLLRRIRRYDYRRH